MGVNGTMYQCNEGTSKTWTCMATMGGGSHRIPFKIFDTDYKSYQIMYSCENIDEFSKTESFAVSSRTPLVTKEFYDKVNKVIKQKIPQYDL